MFLFYSLLFDIYYNTNILIVNMCDKKYIGYPDIF